MPKKIDWLYHRKPCETCKKAEAPRDGVAVTKTVDAAKVRFAPTDALALLDGLDTLIAAKAAKEVRFDFEE